MSKDLQIRKPETVLARPIPRPREPRPAEHHSGFDRADILFALFKHKKKIIFGAIAGLAAAGAVYFFYPAVYESDAKLLVRYLVERSSVDSGDSGKNPGGGYAPATDAAIRSEVEIFTSWDLAVEAAEAIGPKRLLPGFKGTPTKEAAAATIASGLKVTDDKGSNIIFVAYQNRDPELTTLVLNELVNRYFNKHLEVHRSAGAFDFVTQQTDQVRARLNQTEDALKDIKEKAGVFSLEASTEAITSEVVKVEDELHATEDAIAEEQARIRQMRGSTGMVTIIPGEEAQPTSSVSDKSPAKQPSGASATRSISDVAEAPDRLAVHGETNSGNSGQSKAEPSASPEAPPETKEKYDALTSALGNLRKQQTDLVGKYSSKSKRVKAKQVEIDRINKQIRELEKEYPDLPTKVGGSSGDKALDPAAEDARLAGLQGRREVLAARLKDVQQKMRQLAQVGPQIADLERQKQLEATNYDYFQATLEKARVDEALDPSKIPNISAVQRPSPPKLEAGKRIKVTLAVAVGGFAIAAAFALLKEMILNARLRRPSEIEKFIGVTPLMWIPYCVGSNGVSPPKDNGNSSALVAKSASRQNLAPWDLGHFIRPYSEAIRDRLGLYFELHNLTHKPKLVGVAGFSEATGASTLAAGLAAALSETNDGKVLLVDVSLGPDQVHPFFKGKPAYPLQTALKSSGPMDAAAENLYLAKVGSPKAGPAQLGLKKFFDLMPNLRASDFDYIIFDMPPLAQTSPTWGMAPFMDKMLVIVESEKTSQGVVKRGYRRLVTERDNVSLVLNKVRSYAPKSLELEEI